MGSSHSQFRNVLDRPTPKKQSRLVSSLIFFVWQAGIISCTKPVKIHFICLHAQRTQREYLLSLILLGVAVCFFQAPKSLSEHPLVCTVTPIAFEPEVTPGDWDDRLRTVKWVDVEPPAAAAASAAALEPPDKHA